jgi:predicted nucleic acid-binding protein
LKYLLDTCAISENNKKSPNAGFLDFMRSNCHSEFYISVISMGEISNGIGLLPQNDPRKRALSDWIITLIRSFENRILPLDLPVAMLWGNLSASHRKLGFVLPMADGIISATAMVHQLTVVTRNTKDFKEVGASILDPWI